MQTTENNVKHTPGPWTYDEDGMIYAEVESLGKFFSVKVCDPHADKLDIDEREANATLIAAATNLLATVERAYLHLLSIQPGSPHYSFRIHSQDELCAYRDAIAAATGRSALDVQDDYSRRAEAR